jgi:hypothetical protein
MRNLSVSMMLYCCCCIFIGFIPVHVYADSGSTGQFETDLNSFEVEGLSLGMKQSEADIILNSAGYKLKGKVQKKRYTFYKYIQRKDKKKYWVEIYTPPKNDKIETLKIILPDLNGQQTLESEKQRILKAFGKYEKACESSNTFIRCHNFTDTNKLLIEAQFANKYIQYTLQNHPSAEAVKKEPAIKPTKNNNAEVKNKGDQSAAKSKENEDAEWEAAIAAEKARVAEEEVNQAEQELYQYDVDEAVKENTRAIELARKKDAAERVPVHDDKSPDWYIARKGANDFYKKLHKIDVDGFSLGTKVPELEKIMIIKEFSLYKRKLIKGRPYYVYTRTAEKVTSKVEIWADINGAIYKLNLVLENTGGIEKVASEKVRLLKAFSGRCALSGDHLQCDSSPYAKGLYIKVNFAKKPMISYTINNWPPYKRQ